MGTVADQGFPREKTCFLGVPAKGGTKGTGRGKETLEGGDKRAGLRRGDLRPKGRVCDAGIPGALGKALGGGIGVGLRERPQDEGQKKPAIETADGILIIIKGKSSLKGGNGGLLPFAEASAAVCGPGGTRPVRRVHREGGTPRMKERGNFNESSTHGTMPAEKRADSVGGAKGPSRALAVSGSRPGGGTGRGKGLGKLGERLN